MNVDRIFFYTLIRNFEKVYDSIAIVIVNHYIAHFTIIGMWIMNCFDENLFLNILFWFVNKFKCIYLLYRHSMPTDKVCERFFVLTNFIKLVFIFLWCIFASLDENLHLFYILHFVFDESLIAPVGNKWTIWFCKHFKKN